MTAIIHNDVYAGSLCFELVPEVSVGLIADEHPDVIAFIRLARRFDVYAIDVATRAEIRFPHIQAATAVNADFQNVDFAPHERAEMAVVNVEVVLPLPDAGPSLCALK